MVHLTLGTRAARQRQAMMLPWRFVLRAKNEECNRDLLFVTQQDTDLPDSNSDQSAVATDTPDNELLFQVTFSFKLVGILVKVLCNV